MDASATPSPDQPARTPGGAARYARLARYARPALIAGVAVAVVCLVLLVIIFLLDSFNSTVYSVGGKDINDATDEARQIRELYSGVRIGGVVFLVASALTAVGAAVVLVRQRTNSPKSDDDGGEDVGFDALTGR
jgi:ABC-type Fe3+ transport system permease subunit